MMQLNRPGWPGSYLPPAEQLSLMPQLVKRAHLLLYSPTTAGMQQFSDDIAKLLVEKISRKDADPVNAEFDKIIAEQVEIYLAAGLSENQAVLRARKIIKKSAQPSRLAPADAALKEVFSVPMSHRVQLPREDIRSVLLKIAGERRPDKQSGLGKILREASLISHDDVREALGEEIYCLCQPIGFADQWKRILVAKVSSSSAAHKAAYYSTDIIKRLKALNGFNTISQVRFQVQPAAFTGPIQE